MDEKTLKRAGFCRPTTVDEIWEDKNSNVCPPLYTQTAPRSPERKEIEKEGTSLAAGQLASHASLARGPVVDRPITQAPENCELAMSKRGLTGPPPDRPITFKRRRTAMSWRAVTGPVVDPFKLSRRRTTSFCRMRRKARQAFSFVGCAERRGRFFLFSGRSYDRPETSENYSASKGGDYFWVETVFGLANYSRFF